MKNIKKPLKCRPPLPKYVSTNQLTLSGLESPFERELNPNNRWVVLSKLLPWDNLCYINWKHLPEKLTGRPALNPRIVLEALIINNLCDLDDRKTVDQIIENINMQYFLGNTYFLMFPFLMLNYLLSFEND